MKKYDVEKVLKVARSWVGYNFREGQTAQCANFVRSVFNEAGVYVGVASHPTDEKLIPGEPTGPSYADSFAGDDVGYKIAVKNIEPGDIIMYKNTYGNFPSGVITHVAIYEGNGKIIHRPTSDKPVKRENYQYMSIAEIRRVPATASLFEINILDNKVMSCYLDNELVRDAKFKLFVNNGKLGLALNDQSLDKVEDFSLFIKDDKSLYYFNKLEYLNKDNSVQNITIVLDIKGLKPELRINDNVVKNINCSLVVRSILR